MLLAQIALKNAETKRAFGCVLQSRVVKPSESSFLLWRISYWTPAQQCCNYSNFFPRVVFHLWRCHPFYHTLSNNNGVIPRSFLKDNCLYFFYSTIISCTICTGMSWECSSWPCIGRRSYRQPLARFYHYKVIHYVPSFTCVTFYHALVVVLGNSFSTFVLCAI